MNSLSPKTYAEAKARKEKRDAKRGYQRPKFKAKLGRSLKPKKRLRAGRRMKEWCRVWAWLKPRLEAAGRTRCEFDFIPHVCSDILTPAHSKKRRKMIGNDIYAVAIACSTVHKLLDEHMSHAEMETAVLRAVEIHGGMIVP